MSFLYIILPLFDQCVSIYGNNITIPFLYLLHNIIYIYNLHDETKSNEVWYIYIYIYNLNLNSVGS